MVKGYGLLGLLLLAVSSFAQVPEPALIPVPVEVKYSAGSYNLPAALNVSFDAGISDKAFLMQQLVAKFSTAAGITVKESSDQAQLRFKLNKAAGSSESYQLTVNEKGVLIEAPSSAGLFYGLQTLWQLLPPAIEAKSKVEGVNWSLPYCSIKDAPRVGWRGLMLDVARHFFTKEQVKDFIDHMAAYKYNRLHLHLTDDQGWRLEIKALPKLTEIGAFRGERTGRWGEFGKQDPKEPKTYGGYYTQEDIKELLAYAAARHIAILPEIDIPGHSMAILAAYPDLSCTPGTEYQVNGGDRFMHWPGGGKFYSDIDNNLCPANERVYALLDTIFTEVAALFPMEYIHMGGDEAYKGWWEKSPAIKALMQREKLKDMHEVQSYFVKRVSKIIASKGKKMMGWDEIMEGGLAPGAAVMSWQGEKGGIAASKMKHPVVMSPNTYTYVDLYQGDPLSEPPTYGMVRLKKTYEFNPVPAGADPAYVLGGQANLWSERLHTVRHAEYMLWPRAFAVAESVWSPQTKKDWTSFVNRIEKHFDRFDQAGINYSTSMYDPIVSVRLKDTSVEVSMQTEVPNLNIHYSFDEFPPDNYYPEYKSPIVFPAGASTLRVQTYRNGKPIGKLMILPLAELRKRIRK
ncbi:family 20 glycosylhydrolase [Flavihumibacter sp. RY-1]|uniref:beta-N-acetylhexosaminidase n=2 Tax=Bacteroidota TaxID=976 RepID=A0ABS9BCH1_9BACT|nr:beta-N-acetylhexosaminidase [Flavihumibacter fluminis]MCF1713339.1 family 20 glycosylhydrolase [Flavihumibacter fluminis]